MKAISKVLLIASMICVSYYALAATQNNLKSYQCNLGTTGQGTYSCETNKTPKTTAIIYYNQLYLNGQNFKTINCNVNNGESNGTIGVNDNFTSKFISKHNFVLTRIGDEIQNKDMPAVGVPLKSDRFYPQSFKIVCRVSN